MDDYKELLKKQREFAKEFSTQLNGLLDGAPENLKGLLTQLRDKMNDQLEGLKPIEMVEGANEARWALNELRTYIDHMNEVARMFTDTLNAAQSEFMSQRNSLDERVQEYDRKVQDKELVDKESHEEQVRLAKESGYSQALNELKVSEQRKTQVSEAELLEPDGEVLRAEDFDARLTSAKTRAGEIKELGVALNQMPTAAGRAIGAESDEAYQSELKGIKEFAELALNHRPSGGPNPLQTPPGNPRDANSEEHAFLLV